MTKTDILNALAAKVASFEAGPDDELSGLQSTQLCDNLAAELETLNPNHDYPPVVKS